MLNDSMVTAPADVLVIPMTEDLSYAIKTLAVFRDKGIRTQLYGEKKKFKAKISYADKLGIPYVIFIGEDEIKENMITVKDMESGEQKKMTPADDGEMVKEALEKKTADKVIKE